MESLQACQLVQGTDQHLTSALHVNGVLLTTSNIIQNSDAEEQSLI